MSKTNKGQQDLTEDCLDSLRQQGTKVSRDQLQDVACTFCRRFTCTQARGGASMTWIERMDSQVDRLLKNPKFANTADPRFAEVAKVRFKEIYREAYRLEESRKRGDWSIPKVPDLDETPEMPKLVMPKHFQAGDVDPATASPEPAPEMSQSIPEAPPSEPLPPRHKTFVAPKRLNTESPQEGLMIGGGPPPAVEPSTPSVPKALPANPWAIPTEKKIEVGGTVKLGSRTKPSET